VSISADRAQRCASCYSLNGRMTSGRNRAERADDHAAAYQAGIASGLALRYPTEKEH
jgi:hypothetical protein